MLEAQSYRWCEVRRTLAGAMALMVVSWSLHAEDSERFSRIGLVALSSLDGRAVIKTPDNKMHVLKLGSVIPGTKATVTQILSDKLVVEDAEGGTPQTVWITKSGADGSVTVQRLQKDAPPVEAQALNSSEVVDLKKLGKESKKKRD
jgi:hypothetical protein